ncbi:MAG: GHMP kinase [Rhodothermales bacterium]
MIRARAPLRLSFGGGGTDVAPYADERGGYCINGTINLYAYVTLVPNQTRTIRIHSLDYGEQVAYSLDDGPDPEDFQMNLAKGVMDRLEVTRRRATGFDLYTHADCPPGSGLGASSTMVAALIGTFDRWLQLGLDRYETAHLAFEIERKDLGIQGGKQDQYAATFGGFNFMEFNGDEVLVNPLRILPEWVNELEYSMVLAYSGQSRNSADIVSDQIDNYRHQRQEYVEAMDCTKALAFEMKHRLLKGEFEALGILLHDAWLAKKGMSDKVSNPHIDALYEAAMAEGALGGKVSGAGGGGFMFFFTGFDRRHHVIEALEKRGAQVVHFGFTDAGIQTWIR